MTKTPQSAFDNFVRDIEPSKTTKARASQAHTTLRDFLSKHDTFKGVHVRTFLSGSYKRDTAIRPQKNGEDVERPDVDIIIVTNHSLDDSPADVVELLYKALTEKYGVIRKQQRSVGIETADADMDVVPVIEPVGHGGKLYIADRKLEEWIETNPPQHTAWTTEVNTRSDGRFKPSVKMVKWWRRQNPTVSKKPKGFVLECFTAKSMSFTEKHYGELFVGMFESFVSTYAWHVSQGQVPFIADPGVPGNSVTGGLSFDAFEGFYNKAKAHAETGRKALDEDDGDKALALWRQIFGDRFPKFGDAKKAVGLLTGATATESLTFPDRPIRPNKPDGFA
ncbi:MAG: nucleotidyltransferase [Planctomycetes bacterium]|nr:nucleotidyltransferase [Planctomycetota bacterium]